MSRAVGPQTGCADPIGSTLALAGAPGPCKQPGVARGVGASIVACRAKRSHFGVVSRASGYPCQDTTSHGTTLVMPVRR